MNEVAPVARHLMPLIPEPNLILSDYPQIEQINEIDRHHDRNQIMIPVWPSPGHLQANVELGGCLYSMRADNLPVSSLQSQIEGISSAVDQEEDRISLLILLNLSPVLLDVSDRLLVYLNNHITPLKPCIVCR